MRKAGLSWSLPVYLLFQCNTIELLGSCESTRTARRRRARDSSLFSCIRMEHVRWVAFKLQLATRLQSCKVIAYSLFTSTVLFYSRIFCLFTESWDFEFLFIWLYIQGWTGWDQKLVTSCFESAFDVHGFCHSVSSERERSLFFIWDEIFYNLVFFVLLFL